MTNQSLSPGHSNFPLALTLTGPEEVLRRHPAQCAEVSTVLPKVLQEHEGQGKPLSTDKRTAAPRGTGLEEMEKGSLTVVYTRGVAEAEVWQVAKQEKLQGRTDPGSTAQMAGRGAPRAADALQVRGRQGWGAPRNQGTWSKAQEFLEPGDNGLTKT